MIETIIAESPFTLAIAYDVAGNPIYVGEAFPGTGKAATGWRIKRITYDANDNATDVQWADGTSQLDKVWDDRLNYTYS